MDDKKGRVDRAESVKVAVRCRPFCDAELKAGSRIAVDLDVHKHQVSFIEQKGGAKTSQLEFTFDAVFAVDATQLEVLHPYKLPSEWIPHWAQGLKFMAAGVQQDSEGSRGERHAGLQWHRICIRADRDRQNVHNGGWQRARQPRRHSPVLPADLRPRHAAQQPPAIFSEALMSSYTKQAWFLWAYDLVLIGGHSAGPGVLPGGLQRGGARPAVQAGRQGPGGQGAQSLARLRQGPDRHCGQERVRDGARP